MKKGPIIIFLLIANLSCSQSNEKDINKLTKAEKTTTKIEKFYAENKGDDKPSKSTGSVSNGKLINGKLIPFKGKNYQYFDAGSYLGGRAFLNDKVLKTILASYKVFETQLPNKLFYVMECANQEGGKLYPHKTHQNGTSVDFMMPKLKDGVPYSGLDSIGVDHYFLTFDNDGHYSEDQSISIDFNLIAQHILQLNKDAKKNGLKIKKVIINTDLKDELFATEYGKKLKASGIYVVRNLSPLINALHDEHYHIDFVKR